jgi:hypothetical protein
VHIRITEYAEEHVERVSEFNRRLKAGGVPSAFSTRPTSAWLPPLPGRRLAQEQFLALDEREIVRGGYVLKRQDFQLGDEVTCLGICRLPISEGAVDRVFTPVGAQLQWHASKRTPLLYGLGMGSWSSAAVRSQKASGWSHFEVPFLFRVNHPVRFLRGIRCMRKRWHRRVLLDLLAFSGAGWLGIRGLQALRTTSRPPSGPLEVDQVDAFGSWADELWTRCRRQYPMIAVRDSETLCILYPREDTRFIRLRLQEGGRVIGWCVLLATKFTDHRQFGALKVGSFVDAFASTDDAGKIVRAGTTELEKRDVDLIVTNQSHRDWCAALDALGYLRAPSNFLFASCKELTKRMAAAGVANDTVYVNRGDGDGPINL